NAGFSAQGQAGSPTTITMLGGSTYYTFVDSGVFTVSYASFTYMDESGIQLFGGAGAGPWAIGNSTFDYPGSGQSSTSTLITLNGVTNSTITLTNVTYSSTSGNTYNYNYAIYGSSDGLHWDNVNASGGLMG